MFLQYAGVGVKPEEKGKERPYCRKHSLPAALPVGRHALLQGTAYLKSHDVQ